MTTTASPRRLLDADSHVLEPTDWLTPYADPDEEVDFAWLKVSARCFWPAPRPPRRWAPGHPALDPIWARLQDADVPFVTHVGTGGKLVPTGYRENVRPLPPDFLGGGENIRSEDFGWILDNVGPDLMMFSTDFAHPEGTRDPIGGFEAHLERFDDTTREKFYVDNLAELLGTNLPAIA